MRIAFVSDIHGNLNALHAVLADLARRGADQVVNLGDSLSGPLLPRETAAFLMQQPWVHLAGNHERQLLQLTDRRGASDRYAHAQLDPPVFEWMQGLQHAQPLNAQVFLCHGSPRSDVEFFLDTVEAGRVRLSAAEQVGERLGGVEHEVVACGHTHVQRALRSSRGQLLVNPGSVGLQAFEGEAKDYVLENGSPDARYAIVERRNGDWRAELLAVPYDFERAARLAQERGRTDWAHALRTGYLMTKGLP